MITRVTTTLALTALLALPAAASAQARHTRTGSTSSNIGLTGLIGFESGDNYDGLQLRGDLDFGLTRLTPRVDLRFVGSISYARLTGSVNSWEFIPAVRFQLDATPRVDLYGDVGMGLYHLSASGGSNTGGAMRLGVGGAFALTPALQLVAEAGLHPHFGDYDQTTFTLLGGVRYRL
jgi:hypothetical protein